MSHFSRYFFILSSLLLHTCISKATISSTNANSEYLEDSYNTNAENALSNHNIVVDVSKAIHYTTDRYLSMTIDSGQIRRKWEGFDFSSKQLQAIAAGLTPTYIRFGGTDADFLEFDPDGITKAPHQEHVDEQASDSLYFLSQSDSIRPNFTMTGAQWDEMTVFCDKVGWDIMFDFNLFNQREGSFDTTNADLLLKYSQARGVKIPAFQLGNEPDLYSKFDVSIKPDALVQDFKLLKSLILTFPEYDASPLYGPDVANSNSPYLQEFLKAGGCDAVTEVTTHHYYMSGKTATLDDFINPKVLDGLNWNLETAKKAILEECKYEKPLRLSETSSCYGGGAVGLSGDYVAGFMWLDKLGLSAKHRITHVFRQTFFGGSYSLIDENLHPNPDYFLSVLYKRLVEGPVFDVPSSTSTVRLYAHCARKDFYNYPNGALVVYFLNLESQPVTLNTAQFIDSETEGVDLFLLTPGDSEGLLSRFVKLNDEVLTVQGSELPPMQPKYHVGPITVMGHSFGFIVFPSADATLCIFPNF